MANELEQMLKNQLQNNIVHRLDSATQAGDIQAARKAALELSEFQAKNRPANAPSFTNDDIRAALKAKAPWFGVDPRRSAKVVEFGKNMEPASFKSAEEFADKVIEAIEDEFEPGEEEAEEEDEKEEPEKKVARKKTDGPTSSGVRAVPRKASGPWTKLSDAPKDIADTIKSATDKFTRNASKEARQKYIETALGTAYAADQRARGKK